MPSRSTSGTDFAPGVASSVSSQASRKPKSSGGSLDAISRAFSAFRQSDPALKDQVSEKERQKSLAEAIIQISGGADCLSCTGKLLGDSGIAQLSEALASHNTTRWIHLDENMIGDFGASCLAETLLQNTVLRVLDLDCNLICDAGATALAKLLETSTTLSELDLHFNNITADGTAPIAEALRHNKTLVSLSLTGNPIGNGGAVHLAHALTENTGLRELHVADAGVADKGAQHLAMALETNTSLMSLHLGKNLCGNPSAEYFATALSINRTLQELWLLNNDITQLGAKQLMNGVRGNKTLHRLGLTVRSPCTDGVLKDFHVQHTVRRAVNHIAAGGTTLSLDGQVLGDEGVEQLIGSLHKSHNLTELRLKKAGVGNVGACRLAEAMEQGDLQLRVLNLEQNVIGDSGAMRLAEALERNNSLESLSLAGNSLTDTGRTRLVLARENSATLHELYLPEDEITDIDGALSQLEGVKPKRALKEVQEGEILADDEVDADEFHAGMKGKAVKGGDVPMRHHGDDDSVMSDLEVSSNMDHPSKHCDMQDEDIDLDDLCTTPQSVQPALTPTSVQQNDNEDGFHMPPPENPCQNFGDDGCSSVQTSVADISEECGGESNHNFLPPQRGNVNANIVVKTPRMPDGRIPEGRKPDWMPDPHERHKPDWMPEARMPEGVISLGDSCAPVPLLSNMSSKSSAMQCPSSSAPSLQNQSRKPPVLFGDDDDDDEGFMHIPAPPVDGVYQSQQSQDPRSVML